ncbi:MAG: peptide chain release factor N(5)-glutamine methyltransferase [Deltaproteobacteria bacterium]|nr:peptide chain release factor N(5)-glutamine methyltransferase [Deltaproteobacteria bacterium]
MGFIDEPFRLVARLRRGYSTSVLSEQPRDWTIRDVVAWMTDDLRKRSVEGARLDAELIVAQALGIDRVKVIVEGQRLLDPQELEAIRALFKRRRGLEPVAYLRGFREFYGRPFRVDRRVLIPRPDTETLIDVALERLRGHDLGARVVDLCTGSGCVAITLKLERPTLTVDATDLSEGAIAVARDNAQRLGAVWNVRFAAGDLFGPLGPPRRIHDLVVANPPYIATGEIAQLQPDIRDHEPRLALDGGEDGLVVVRRIVAEAPQWLRPGGALALELAAGQAEEVERLFLAAGFDDVRRAVDYGGHERVVSGRVP